MLKEIVNDWAGNVDLNGEIMSASEASSKIDFNALQTMNYVTLLSSTSSVFKSNSDALQHVSNNENHTMYEVTVKTYMTKPASPEFDFMAKWNNNKPMPMCTMIGWIEKETRGMVYMHLRGLAKPTITCRCCQRELTNPVSRNYGIGPICLNKMGIHLDIDNISGITERLVNMEWEGWVIRSSILKKEEVES